jgi:hypothetical protein
MRLVVLAFAAFLELFGLLLPNTARADDLPEEERIEQLVSEAREDEAGVLVEETMMAHRDRARALLARFSHALLRRAAASGDEELRAAAAKSRGKAPVQRPAGCSNAEIIERLLAPTTPVERIEGAAQFVLFGLDRA